MKTKKYSDLEVLVLFCAESKTLKSIGKLKFIFSDIYENFSKRNSQMVIVALSKIKEI
jgi:hypothetical protein